MLTFFNNSASKGSSLLYSEKLGTCFYYNSGGSILLKECNVKLGQNLCSNLHLDFKNVDYSSEFSVALSADTEEVKFCTNSHYSLIHTNVTVYAGKKFNVSLLATGTLNLNLSTEIWHENLMLFSTEKKIELRRVQHFTMVNSLCTNVSYYLLVPEITSQLTAHFKLFHQNPCNSLVDGLSLYINIKPCPLGFQLSTEHQICTCDKWFLNLTDKCNIDNLSIERKRNTFWVSKQINDYGLIIHNGRCPFDFCKNENMEVPLNDPIFQCAYNRNGTLCGKCREQYSLALGTLHCLYCVNSSYVTLVIPFALAGIALVMVILLLHLTVDVGTLNGLIFYANIIHSNREVYFQYTREITNFDAIFIAWLNLDIGIQTCFYDGLDIYAYSWLQFLFPFYLWFLIGAIIIICHYSQKLSNILKRNPVATLGTVLFLSYGKNNIKCYHRSTL